MALRTITYGYEMKDGKITVCVSEAEVIEQIYRRYAAGMTFVQIASELTEMSVRYFGDNSQWNKNMVHRIVGNVRVLIDCIKVNTDSTLTVIIKGGVPITVDIPT